jgi:hypothetical protein
MKKMRFALSIACCAALLLAVVPMAHAANTVNATVTTKLISVAVDTPGINYGTLQAGDATMSPTVVTATNDGNITETFQAECSTAARSGGGGLWQVDASAPATDTFRADLLQLPATVTALDDIGAVTWATGVAPAAAKAFQLGLVMPTFVNAGGLYTWTVTISAIE